MEAQLDEELVAQARRAPRSDGLTLDERIALNLFWRKGVRVPVLAKVFQCSKNTIYYNCLTGYAESYPSGRKAQEVNAIVDRLGVEEAWKRHVSPEMIRAVNAANKKLVEQTRAP